MQLAFLNGFKTFFQSTLGGSEVNHIFCWIILTTFIGSLIWLWRISLKVAFPVKELSGMLNTFSGSSRSDKAIQVINQIKEKEHVLKNFSQSLVEILEDGIIIYKRTQPTTHYLSPETINPKLFKGYFMIWIPSILTTLGVLGTFVGLQIGLGGINLNGDVEQMLDGIRVLIDGAKTAFSTSIFGVASGIGFGLLLRIIRQRQSNKIHSLCCQLDQLIPETSPEDDLRHLRGASELSVEQLKALREEVGPQLQKTLVDMPSLIGNAVGQQIQEAVGGIGQQNSQALGEALKDVHQEHLADLKGLGEAIRSQVEITNKILEKLEQLPPRLESSSVHLETSSKSLENVSEKFGGWDEKLETFSVSLQTSSSSFDSATASLESASKLIESTIPNLQEAVGSATKATQTNQQALSENSRELLSSFGSITDGLQGFSESAQALTKLTPSLQATTLSLNTTAETLEEANKAQLESSKNNKNASDKFEAISVHFEEATKHLSSLGDVGKNLTEAGTAAQGGFTTLQGVTKQLESLTSTLSSIAEAFNTVREEELGAQFSSATVSLEKAAEKLEHMNSASEKLEYAGTQASQLFTQAGEEHNTFITGLTTGVAALKEEIASLLETYRNSMADQTKQRISDWNNEASNFAISFSSKVDDLNGSIEDLGESLATMKA